MNTSCGDTVKCRLDAGKSPIFRSQSPCTYIYVQESQRFWDFIRIYTYESTKGLRLVKARANPEQWDMPVYWMNLPPCWPGGGGGGRWSITEKFFISVKLGSPALCIYYGDCSRHLELVKKRNCMLVVSPFSA